MKKIIVKEIKQTCIACPSQWEGKLEDGRMIYIRYRWDTLSISISKKPTDDIFEAVDGIEIFRKWNIEGNPFAGELSYKELKKILKKNKVNIVLPEKCENEYLNE